MKTEDIVIDRDTTLGQIEQLKKLVGVRSMSLVQMGKVYEVDVVLAGGVTHMGRCLHPWESIQLALRNAHGCQEKCSQCGRIRPAHEQGTCTGPIDGWK